ncbi:MAG TPA: preprotein translocase subunit SecY [Candidatus Ornithoclostridium faecavium]|nr:preprotein translocase subunit SecY [Candidatus Ornithoclostridium faecavium]
MWQTLVNAFKDRSLRIKIFITLGLLLVYRIGCYIPVPGLDFNSVQSAVTGNNNTLLQIMNVVSGGSLAQGTLFALGILPFINSFIIMQLLTLIIPPLERMSKEGDAGRAKITQITRYVAILLAIVQGIGIVVTFHNSGAIEPTFGSEAVSGAIIILILTAGSTLVMWLSERITEYGIGNGSSMIIFIGIVASFATSLVSAFGTLGDQPDNIWYILGYLILVLVMFLLIVFIDGSERRIKVNYAKQVKGNKMYGGQSTYIPMKVNASGVMPIIFASAFLMFPQMILSFFPQDNSVVLFYVKYLGAGTAVYYIFTFIFIIFFAYFYAQIQFNPIDVARNLQQYGGTIQGVRPGKPTSEYLAKINSRITLFGALFLAFIAIVPTFGFNALGQPIGMTNAFSATGMLIIVSVALELDKQLESQIMMKHYKGFLK